MTANGDDVGLPEGTVDLEEELVPAVRALLRKGLDGEFLKSSVRVHGFTPFGGGLKAALVGGLRIDVDAALKLGDEELELHQLVMDRVNRTRPRTFPTVELLVKLGGGRRLMFMEQLRGHETLLDAVYRRPLRQAELERIVDKIFAAVTAVRRTTRTEAAALRRLPRIADPYTDRLRDRIGRVIDADPRLAVILDEPGEALGVPVPPIGSLLDDLGAWMKEAIPDRRRALCHGDLHLGNIMVRRRGRGHELHLIDPNPTIGITDALYDAGKLLHFAEPVGWTRIDAGHCTSRFSRARRRWTLDARLEGAPAAAERRRAALERAIRARLSRPELVAKDPTRPARTFVSTAAAHVGLAAILAAPSDNRARGFVLAHALRALGLWSASR